jgi:UDPglucose 6-dehydrogenase
VGYGGGCFPKDVQALLGEGERAGQVLTVLQAAHDANYRQRTLLYDKMSTALGGVRGKRVALLGLAFKPKTDDIRDAPAMYFVKRLLEEGANVVAYDPEVKQSKLTDYPNLALATTALAAAAQAEAVVLLCEWPEFQGINLVDLKKNMQGHVLVDGRYVWSRAQAQVAGFVYVA